jgi:nicotinate-nucleotide adenylyltransferase
MPTMKWNEITAVFGGTFDPPHLGHTQAIEGLLREPGVKRVLIIPSARPPHKPEHATAAQRWAMAKLAFKDIPGCALRAETTSSYSFDTLQDLRRDYGDKLAFVIGTDQLAKLDTWYKFPEVLDLCHWIVLERKGGSPADLAPLKGFTSRGDRSFLTPGGRTLQLFPTPAISVSSTEIRRQIALTGQVAPGSLKPEIQAYLNDHGIYGSSASKADF